MFVFVILLLMAVLPWVAMVYMGYIQSAPYWRHVYILRVLTRWTLRRLKNKMINDNLSTINYLVHRDV